VKELFIRLTQQCTINNVPVIDTLPNDLSSYDVIVDAIFGYSFTGEVRAPFDNVLKQLKTTTVPIVAVDIPSGWNVETGNSAGVGLEPAVLISLTAPKLCAKHFKGVCMIIILWKLQQVITFFVVQIHVLGGRFVPSSIAEQFELNLPQYTGIESVIVLPSNL